MFQYITTSQRKNTLKDFYFFQTEDSEFMLSQIKLRHDIISAPGFVSMSIEVSEDKLTMVLKTTWVDYKSATSFFSTASSSFNDGLNRYLRQNGHLNRVSQTDIADPPEFKQRKLAQEATAEEIAEIMKVIIKDKNV